jgi:hypothetical protein
MMDLEKYIKEVINMETISWIMFVNGILLGWWLPIIGRLLFIELPVSLKYHSLYPQSLCFMNPIWVLWKVVYGIVYGCFHYYI